MQSVLIVDDIAENLYFLEVLLKGNGFDVRTALNGAEALQSARGNPPCLVISDILMPVMDGYTLCREWRADEQLRQIPFMFYTATFTEKKDEALALSLGADHFVIKPQEPDVLMGVIRGVLSSVRVDAPEKVHEADLDEGGVLREYSKALFRKLEKKMADLEKANRGLEERIEEQKRLEEQLRQAQKMEAIGRFSAGIAHDFNNILTVIMSFGSMLQVKLEGQKPLQDKLNHIMSAADRARHLTSSLLTFSSRKDIKLQPIDLNSTIVGVETFLRRVIGEDVQLVTNLADCKITVMADSGQLEQVLMNLAVNSRDAMPDGGSLTIATDIVTIDKQFVLTHGYGQPGQYAALSITDTGTGMDADTRQRVFEPFFTTKQLGQGTGLGLSIVYGIVQQYGGNICIESELGRGTTFRIFLPLLADEVHDKDVAKTESPQGCGETILVVDDDEAIRGCIEMLLDDLGYRVICAANGEDALALLRQPENRIDLVLMDVIMPGKNARDTASEMRSIRAGVKILFCSGYAGNLIYERQILDSSDELLPKPLTPHEVAARIRKMLDQ